MGIAQVLAGVVSLAFFDVGWPDALAAEQRLCQGVLIPGSIRDYPERCAVVESATRIFLSWAHRDRKLKEALLADLLPALGMLRDISIEWWEDSHLTCGEELTPNIVERLDEADFGLLLLSNHYFGSSFIRRYELPRFANTGADKGSLPVALGPLPGFGPSWNMGGIERQLVFTSADRSFAEASGAKRTIFANELAAAIRRRLLGLNGYRPL